MKEDKSLEAKEELVVTKSELDILNSVILKSQTGSKYEVQKGFNQNRRRLS